MRAEVDALSVRSAMHLVFGAAGIDEAKAHDGVPVFNVRSAEKATNILVMLKFGTQSI